MLRLIPIDPALSATLEEGADAFERAYGAALDDMLESARDVVGMMLKLPGAPPPWCGYLVADTALARVVGTCAFKAPPDAEGAVEIAYFTFPPYEGRGYATRMARALIALARESPDARTVLAHTLPVTNASNHLLQKLGMTYEGEVIDPEDGPVWRWAMPADGA